MAVNGWTKILQSENGSSAGNTAIFLKLTFSGSCSGWTHLYLKFKLKCFEIDLMIWILFLDYTNRQTRSVTFFFKPFYRVSSLLKVWNINILCVLFISFCYWKLIKLFQLFLTYYLHDNMREYQKRKTAFSSFVNKFCKQPYVIWKLGWVCF